MSKQGSLLRCIGVLVVVVWCTATGVLFAWTTTTGYHPGLNHSHVADKLEIIAAKNNKLGSSTGTDAFRTTAATSTKIEKSSKSTINTDAWLRGPRFNNSNDPLIDDAFVQRTILNVPRLLKQKSLRNLSAILEQTLAVEGSRILNLSSTSTTPNIDVDLENLRLWSIRMQYIAIHVHQHLPALKEAQSRSNNSKTQQQLRQYNVGAFEYECPGTNYLLTNLLNFGIGADVYNSMVHGFKAGLATNRVVHFVNQQLPHEKNYAKNAPYRPGWHQASCARRDYQCTFLPPSPCVPTIEDIENGYQLNETELRDLYEQGVLPDKIDKTQKIVFAVATAADMVWITSKLMGRKAEAQVRKIIQDLIEDNDNNLHSSLPDYSGDDDSATPGQRKLYQKAVARSWRFGRDVGTLETMLTALTSYALRPRPEKALVIESQVLDSLPSNFDPLSANAVGLPIRASDKCIDESECLTFEQHMQAVKAEWTKHMARRSLSNGHDNTTTMTPSIVIFTTESKQMVQEMLQYQERMQLEKGDPPILFIRNKHDAMPSTGWYSGNQADEMLLSALTCIKLQLYSRLTVANCCSNFARTMKCLLEGGFGAVATSLNIDDPGQSSFRCLQEADDPRLRPCCWKEEACLQQKANDTKAFLAKSKTRRIELR